jgi:hypothetical protein
MSDIENLRRLWDEWRPPAELERSRPRPVRFSGQGKFILVVMLALVAGGLIGAVLLSRESAAERRDDRLLALAGSDSEARITRLWRTSGKRGRCFAAYQFRAAEAVVTTSAAVSCGSWRSLTEGQSRKVRYIAGNPALNRLEGIAIGNRTPIWLAPFIGFILILSALLIARRLVIERRLLEEGHAAPGVVTKLGIRTDKGRKVHYEFATYSGTAMKGSFGPAHGKNALPPGTPIVVLYDRDDPKRNTRYPPSLFRLDY